MSAARLSTMVVRLLARVLLVVLATGSLPAAFGFHATTAVAAASATTIPQSYDDAANPSADARAADADATAVSTRLDVAPGPSLASAGVISAPRGAIGFAPGEGVSALTTNRLQHGTRHLSEAGVLPPWRGSSSPQIIRDALSPVLERPTAAFDHVLGGTRVRGFLGDVNGQQIAAFVFKEGPYQGQLASSVIPTANQLAKWGIP